MTSFARIETSAHEQPTEFVHVSEPEKTDELVELCNHIDVAFDRYKDRNLDLRNFGWTNRDVAKAQYCYALAGLQRCIGNLSAEQIDIFKGSSVSSEVIEQELGKMLWYMEVLAMSYDKDLTDARDECERTNRALMKV